MKVAVPTIETVALTKLKPWKKNPRTAHAVDKIRSSIEKFGYLSPIIVQKKTYRILSGHGRLKALRKAAVKQVPVIVASISDRDADLFTVADNKISDLSTFDIKATADLLKGLDALELELTGFSLDELKKLNLAAGEIDSVLNVAAQMPKSGFYAGDDNKAAKIAANDRALVVIMETEEELKKLRSRIQQLQANGKSIGQVVYEQFFGTP